MAVPPHQRKALTSIANKNEVRGLCNAFGAGEVEDCDPPVAPSAGSAREEAPQLQPPERTTPGQEPCTARGPPRQTQLELAEKGCQGRGSQVLRLHLCSEHTLLLWFCAGQCTQCQLRETQAPKASHTPRGAAGSRRLSDPDCPGTSPVLLPCAQSCSPVPSSRDQEHQRGFLTHQVAVPGHNGVSSLTQNMGKRRNKA